MRRAIAALSVAAVTTAGIALSTASGNAHRRPPVSHVSRPSAVGPPPTNPTTTTTAPPTTTMLPHVDPSIAALAARLDPLAASTATCLLVTDGITGATLYSHQADIAFVPASTQKLLVAAAALDRLGPDFRFTTTVVAGHAPVGGTLDDAWLVGGGDPLLSSPAYADWLQRQPLTSGRPTTPLSALVAGLTKAGIHLVRNGIHGDDSRYERLRFVPTWPAFYRTQADIGPLGALEVDDGYDQWTPREVDTADPAAHAAAVLSFLLGAQGISAPPAGDQAAPAGAVVLASVSSPPLSELVAEMLRSSDNMAAELVTRELDRQAGGAGSTAGGGGVVARAVAGLGVATNGLQLHDGSGLDPGNHTSCRTLLQALNLGDQARFAPLRTGLAQPGTPGTLVNRLLGTLAVGHLWAKTGSIQGVNAMVGRLDEGHPLRFALVANGPFTYAVGIGLEDRVVAALGAYPN